jgi:hypothetical protein
MRHHIAGLIALGFAPGTVKGRVGVLSLLQFQLDATSISDRRIFTFN